MGLEFPRLDLGYPLPMKKTPPADSGAEVPSYPLLSGSCLPASRYPLPMKKKLPPADSTAELLSDLRHSGSGLPASGFGLPPADEQKNYLLPTRPPNFSLTSGIPAPASRPLASGYPLPMKKKELPPADSTAEVLNCRKLPPADSTGLSDLSKPRNRRNRHETATKPRRNPRRKPRNRTFF